MTKNLHVPGAKADSGKATPRLLAEDFPHALLFLYGMPVVSGVDPEAMLKSLMLAPADNIPLAVSVQRLLSSLTYRDTSVPAAEARAKALYAASDVAGFGMRKYTAGGWKHVDNGVVRYTEALYRHLVLWVSGEECDLDSGRLHLHHLIWNCMAILELLSLENTAAQRLY